VEARNHAVKYGDPATMVFPNLEPMKVRDIDWDAKENWALSSSNNWRWFCGADYRI